VVEGKEGVESNLFQLALARDATPTSFHGFMFRNRMMAPEKSRVMGVLIGKPVGVAPYVRFQFLHHPVPSLSALIRARAIFFPCDFRQKPFCRHLSHLKIQNLTHFRLNRECYAEWLALTVFTRFKVVKLNHSNWVSSETFQKKRVLKPCASR